MFWKNEEEYNIIEDVSIEELQKFLKENNIYLSLDTLSGRWAGFSNYYGRQHGLNEFESASFSTIISTFMTGMSASAGTEYYYNEDAIENKVLDMYNDLQKVTDIDETSKKRRLFNEIFKLYKEDIGDYEFKIHNLNFRVTEKQYQKFLGLPGDGKTGKFLYMLSKF